MNKHTDSDLQAELAALRQRLSNLEAEHRELKRQATLSRRPTFSRKFLLSALLVALLLTAVGALYAVDALFIDTNGNVRIGGAVGINRDAISNQQLVIQPKQGYAPFNVTDPAGNVNWLSVLSDGKVIMNGGNVGIGTQSPVSKLTINNKILDDNYFKYDDAPLTIFEPNNNGGNKPNATRDILHLVRAGVADQAFGNKVSFALGRYENVGTDSRTQLDIKLTEGSFNSHPAIMSLRSNGNVGIGKQTPTAKLDVAGDANFDGKLTCRSIVQEPWRPVGEPGFPPFQNTWVNYFKSDNKDPYNIYNKAGYFKDSMGIVHLKGMVMKGSETIFILPAGYRPIARELFACLSGDSPGRVDVLETGEVTLQKGNAAEYVSLDGLTFRAGR